ncbi:unnamed protein product, partial [Pylaiella littoralis]
FKNDETTFYFDLQRRLYTWLKEVKSEHTLFRDREDVSGGAGADPSSDGEDSGDSRHAFHFMGGRLATMLWEDGIRVVAGGNESKFTGDPVNPDSHAGSGSSIP